jgi:hypothetical protein
MSEVKRGGRWKAVENVEEEGELLEEEEEGEG